MTQPSILEDLDKLGEALKATGEQVSVGYLPASEYFTEERFWVRLERPGTPGAHGSGLSVSSAYRAAQAQREQDALRLDVEAQVRAEVEQRMQRREAA